MKLPLEILRDWFDALPEAVAGNLSFFVIIRLMKYDPLRIKTENAFREWIGAKLDYFQHTGRALSACAIIDYVMQEQGDPHHWEENLDAQLNILESDVTPDLKGTINKMLPRQPELKAAWLNAASSWRQLRESSLSHDALHSWEDEMQRQFY